MGFFGSITGKTIEERNLAMAKSQARKKKIVNYVEKKLEGFELTPTKLSNPKGKAPIKKGVPSNVQLGNGKAFDYEESPFGLRRR